MKLSLKGYTTPTPKTIKRAADAILAVSASVSTVSYVMDNHKLAVIILIVSSLAKLLSNFIVDDTPPPTT